MAAPDTDPDLAQRLLDQLEWVELHVSNPANLVGADETDPGTVDWWAGPTVEVPPDDDHDDVPPWYEDESTALSVKILDDEAVGVTVLEANGLTIDLQHVNNLHNALDARSADYAEFIPLFGGRDRFGFVILKGDQEEDVQSLGSHAVIIDRVRLAPA